LKSCARFRPHTIISALSGEGQSGTSIDVKGCISNAGDADVRHPLYGPVHNGARGIS
jgi:hypothetical protein